MALTTGYENGYLTEAEYLAAELVSEVKHEYIDGQVYAMTGASDDHARIAGNIFAECRNHLKGMPCEAFMSDIKVRLGKDYVYPDVLVDCRDASADKYFAQAPLLIVEVLSKSTRKTDLKTKLLRYINLPSLLEYVLIDQETTCVHILRKHKHWMSEFYFLGDKVHFEAIDLTVSVEDIYDRVDNEDLREFRQANTPISTE